MRVRVDGHAWTVPGAQVDVTPVIGGDGKPRVEVAIRDAGGNVRVERLRFGVGARAVLADDLPDFRPGQVIVQRRKSDGTVKAHYTVLDPPRTARGKLRLAGPLGGYVTTWWRPDNLPDTRQSSYAVEPVG